MSPSKSPAPSKPAPDADSEQPEPVPAADAAIPDETVEVAEDGADTPLNRADRRAKAKGIDPSHVGPRAGRTTQGRSARSHTKRQIS